MAKSISKHQEEIKNAMMAVGTYRQEFDTAIKQLAVRLRDQEMTRKQFRAEGSAPLVPREGKFGTYQVKNPLLPILGEQNRDVDSLLDKLGLTPAGLKKINDEMKKKPGRKSTLAQKVTARDG